MPPHHTYIEAFLGGGAVLRNKRPAAVNIGIDADAGVIDAWRGRKIELVEGWRARSMDMAMQTYDGRRIGRLGKAAAGVNGAAVRTPLPALTARSGGMRSRSGSLDRAMADPLAPGGGAAAVEFYCGDAVEFLRQYRFEGTELVYADPPYMLATREKRKLYAHEMTDAQHRALLRVLLRLPCFVMVSGYRSKLYAEMLAGWHTFRFSTMTRGGRPAVEHVWSNFPPPLELHDYTWLGDDYREREKVARMRRRWVRRLADMPRLQRLALQWAFTQV